jgi:S1-C subfamily serine protease
MILRFVPLVALALFLGRAAPAPAAETMISVPEAMLRAKPAVVLVTSEVAAEVTLDCGSGPATVKPPAFRETGTGWFIDGTGWVITNGHVVQPAHETPRWLVNQQAQRAVSMACLPKALEREGISPGDRPDKEDAIKRKLLDRVLPTVKVTLQPQVLVLASNGLRLRAEVKKYSPPVSAEPDAPSARDLAVLKIPGDDFPVLRLADSKVAQIGDPIHIVGFPGVVLSHELLKQSAASMEASVTNGAVSGYKEDRSGHPLIQTDAPASWGNSGGPALDDRGAVVGVLTFVSLGPGPEGSIVQGFNFLIPSEAVRNFVKDTPVNLNSMGKFNPIWYAGLRAFFTEDWKGAERQFEQVEKLLPGLPDVKRMLGEAREKVKNPPPRPFPWFWVAIGVTLASGGGYGAQLYIRWQRNRYRVRPGEVVRLMEEGKQPVILDTRKTEVYEKLPLKIPGSVRLAPEDLDSGISGLDLDPNRPVVAYCT